MAVNASKGRFQYDVDAAVLLRDVADGAETSTALETAVDLKELDAAYWHANEIPHGVMAVVVNVTALDTADGNETYTLALLVDDVVTLDDSPFVIASYAITQVGTYVMYVDSKSIPGLNPETSGSSKWMGIRATLAGTSPSITYGAWIAKSVAP